MSIVPSILTDSFLTLQQEVDAVKFSSGIEAVQIDVVDGQFADNITVTPLDLTVGDYEPLKLDFHLMTEEPLDFVYECEAVRDYLPIRRIYGQIERMSSQADFLWEVKANNWQAGLALDLFTPLESIDEDVWLELDYLLLMGVEAGAQGRTFHELALEKVQEARQLAVGQRPLHILVDGGIKLTNVKKIFTVGADEVTVGSELWTSPDPLLTLEKFTQIR